MNLEFDQNDCLLIVVDIQEKLCPAMPNFEYYCKNMKNTVATCGILDIPVIVTEQYPKGLGNTIEAIACELAKNTPIISKLTFSCWGGDGFSAELLLRPQRTLILIGMETHVCVQQTALEALKKGYEVIILADAVSSQSESDKNVALDLLRVAGVTITTFQALVFAWLKSSKHPEFKIISKLIK